MDRYPKIWGDNLGVAAKKAQDFLLGKGVWDLEDSQPLTNLKAEISASEKGDLVEHLSIQ